MKLSWAIRVHLWWQGHSLEFHSRPLCVCNCGKQWVR